VLLVLLVVLPTGLLAWLAIAGVRDERRRVAGQLSAAATSRLADIDARILRVLDDRARRLLELTGLAPGDARAWRQLVRTTPEVSQVVVQSVDGQLLHPPLADGISESESEFLRRIRGILEERLLLDVARQSGAVDSRVQQKVSPPTTNHGWYAWYWDTGLHLLFWRLDPAGHLVVVELDRARLVSDLLVVLSLDISETASTIAWGRVVLEDSQGRVLSQTGGLPDDREVGDSVERRLSPPLAAWNLRAEYWRGASVGSLGVFLRLAGLMLVAAVLGVLAFVFHRESSRELREARQRVAFVNQVSHELRTPLTNIRLYAELLQRRIGDDNLEAHADIDVIVAESGRLSRLIGNVLNLARRQRDELVLHPVEGSLDDTLRSVAAQFRPSLEGRGVEITLDLAAPRPVAFDPDAIEQIVGNLLSNVEKYAAAGGVAELSSRQSAAATTVRVVDQGPGIPEGREEAVFEPFVRLSDRLTEGVAGTGIGLSIARELARLHGGELRIVAAESGACFELELPGGTGGETT
jgi:signal transduction histidine kinase